jgi:hypothetical protein
VAWVPVVNRKNSLLLCSSSSLRLKYKNWASKTTLGEVQSLCQSGGHTKAGSLASIFLLIALQVLV